ncbi:alpha/beta hydrolase [Streptomyces sp. A1277]|uniref:alpha/beta hydrolase n=1 Tax=Streptomyces sp. A1277 TaxID=2563103 RepID=UPI0010A29B19|nr:alpha/beta hydrolase [Streptomyces sp. A1277]THA34082.1 alpha/beta hydrolase [Streptomyces sp. A1277]
MPMGYVVSTALLTWCTFFSVVAPRRPRPLANLSFWFGMVLNEVPVIGILAVLASTALAEAQGDLDSTASKVTAVIALATIPVMAVAVWRGLRAGRVVERALDEGLGAGRRSLVPEPPRPSWPRLLLLRRLTRNLDVVRIPNLSYGDAGRRNLLDVYRRRDAPQNGPVLIYFHGGGFTSGGKSREARPLLYRLASQGWVCISANYRLRPETDFPGHQIDAKKVIAWAREHAAEYGADPSKVFVAGSSAGSNMAAMCALTPNDPQYQPGFESADTSVTAAICLYGYYGFFFGAEPDVPPSPNQPYAYLNPGAPPILIAHGTKDALATVEGARYFVDRLRGVSNSAVVYAELPGAQHAFDLFHSARCEAVVDGVQAFTAWVLARSGRAAEPAPQPEPEAPPTH